MNNDKAVIPKGSKFEGWQDALSFLEYYGLPLMSGFGIIIIDNRDVSKDKYFTITNSNTETEKCFERASKMAISALVSTIGLAFTLIN